MVIKTVSFGPKTQITLLHWLFYEFTFNALVNYILKIEAGFASVKTRIKRVFRLMLLYLVVLDRHEAVKVIIGILLKEVGHRFNI